MISRVFSFCTLVCMLLGFLEFAGLLRFGLRGAHCRIFLGFESRYNILGFAMIVLLFICLLRLLLVIVGFD